MAPPKKRKKRKSQKHAYDGGSSASIDTRTSSKADLLVSNEENGCSCVDYFFAMGFDPYVTVKHFPSNEKFATKPVYNAKRAVKWTKAEKNIMQWYIDPTTLEDSVLSLAVYDEEVGTDPQIGTAMIMVNEFVQNIGDEDDIELTIRRNGSFSGVVSCKIKLLAGKSKQDLQIKLIINEANYLKKERETDVSTDQSTMFWVTFGFTIYLVVFGAIFWAVERPESDPDAPDEDSEEWEEYTSYRILTWWDGFWFVFVTATTVGYGDYFPKTLSGRYLNSFVICIDVLFIGFALGLIVDFIAASADRASHRLKKKEADESEKVNKFIRQKSGIIDPDEGEEEDVDERELALKEIREHKMLFWWDLTAHSLLFLALIFGGSLFFYFEEKDNGWSYAMCLHFCCVTLSTVGYGDISPNEDSTRVFCLFYIILGVSLLVRLGGLVCDKIVEEQQQNISNKRADESLMHWEQIKDYDLEDDGKLDLFEFCRVILKATGKATDYDFQMIDDRFDQIDRDGSGNITKEDFALLARERAEQALMEASEQTI